MSDHPYADRLLFNDADRMEIEFVAEQRDKNAVEFGLQNTRAACWQTPEQNTRNNLVGIAAEYAASVLLRREWVGRLVVGTDMPEYDLSGGIDVKYMNPKWGVWDKASDDDSKIIVGVSVDWPDSATVVGWCTVAEVRESHRWAANAPTPNFLLRPEDLHDIESLPA